MQAPHKLAVRSPQLAEGTDARSARGVDQRVDMPDADRRRFRSGAVAQVDADRAEFLLDDGRWRHIESRHAPYVCQQCLSDRLADARARARDYGVTFIRHGSWLRSR